MTRVPRSPRLLARAGATVLTSALAVGVLVAATPDRASVVRALDDPAAAVARAGVEGAVVHLLAAAAWLCLAWLVLGAAAAGLAHVPGTVGRAADRVAGAVTPALVRRAVEALLGLGALAGVVAPTAASAAPPALTAGPAAVAAVVPAPATAHGPVVPSVDWPGRAGVAPDADWPTTPRTDRPLVPPRTSSRAPASAGQVVPSAVRHAADEALVVRRGDTLWTIAARHLGPGATSNEVARAWPAWHEANRAVIGADPDRLLPGQRLVPPT